MQTTWKGASGKTYTYMTFRMPHEPSDNGKGNYIFSRLVGAVHYAVYVGQGDLRDRYRAAIREGCVTRKGATHHHYHTDNRWSEASRRQEERDIINGNPSCKEPRGCNG